MAMDEEEEALMAGPEYTEAGDNGNVKANATSAQQGEGVEHERTVNSGLGEHSEGMGITMGEVEALDEETSPAGLGGAGMRSLRGAGSIVVATGSFRLHPPAPVVLPLSPQASLQTYKEH